MGSGRTMGSGNSGIWENDGIRERWDPGIDPGMMGSGNAAGLWEYRALGISSSGNAGPWSLLSPAVPRAGTELADPGSLWSRFPEHGAESGNHLLGCREWFQWEGIRRVTNSTPWTVPGMDLPGIISSRWISCSFPQTTMEFVPFQKCSFPPELWSLGCRAEQLE
uniref:Uncharacterized protein n=1 Tax=Cyanistes caeruleus TaxID=156563 RepID=A0A8C0UAA7_CYACU